MEKQDIKGMIDLLDSISGRCIISETSLHMVREMQNKIEDEKKGIISNNILMNEEIKQYNNLIKKMKGD